MCIDNTMYFEEHSDDAKLQEKYLNLITPRDFR